MKNSINIDTFNSAMSILSSFCGNMNITMGFDNDLTNRTTFALNFQKALNSVDVEDNDTVDTLNTFFKNISDYHISIKDIYDVVKTTEFNIVIVADYLNNVYENIGSSAQTELLYEIYTCIVKSSNTCIEDLLNNIKHSAVVPDREYIKPLVKYSYVKSNEYFSSLIDVMRDFYDPNSTWYEKIYENGVTLAETLVNAQLRNLVTSIYTSYDRKNCELLKINNLQYENDSLINFIKKIKYDNSFSTSLFFYYNTYTNDIPFLLSKITSDCYYDFMAQTNPYGREDLYFNVDDSMSKLNINTLENITSTSFKYDLFKSAIKNDSTILEYGKEVNKVKEYLNDIIAYAKTNSKYVVGV